MTMLFVNVLVLCGCMVMICMRLGDDGGLMMLFWF